MFDAEFKTRMLNAGKRPCRCGRMMPEYLELCFSCQWNEAEAARKQESLDLAAECEGYADEMDWHMREANRAATRDDDFEWGAVEAHYQDWREADRYDLADTQASVIASMRGW